MGYLNFNCACNCLRHMDPYFFYSGFSDRWYEKFLSDFSFEVISIDPVGDYYSWLATKLLSQLGINRLARFFFSLLSSVSFSGNQAKDLDTRYAKTAMLLLRRNRLRRQQLLWSDSLNGTYSHMMKSF